MVIKEALKIGLENLRYNEYNHALNESRLILSFLMGVDQAYLHAYPNEKLEDKVLEEYLSILNRRKNKEPLQYIFKRAYFYGREYYVDERVLIPRPDTEILVEKTIELSKKIKAKKILEIGVGSGAVSITVAKEFPEIKIVGVDISYKALEVARINQKKHGVKNLDLFQSDLFSNITGKYDIIISNPPYISSEEMDELQDEVKKEPELALRAGEDGLDFYRSLGESQYKYLVDDGFIIYEIGYDQYDSVKRILEINGYAHIGYKKDLSGYKRVIFAKKEE